MTFKFIVLKSAFNLLVKSKFSLSHKTFLLSKKITEVCYYSISITFIILQFIISYTTNACILCYFNTSNLIYIHIYKERENLRELLKLKVLITSTNALGQLAKI